MSAVDPDLKQVNEAERLDMLRVKMEQSAEHPDVTPAIRQFVSDTLNFGVSKTRKEYRGYARRNWLLIQQYAKRLARIFVVLVIVLSALGGATWWAFKSIQDSRHERLLELCRNGAAFKAKLNYEIDHAPAGKEQQQARKNGPGVEALVATITPLTIQQCNVALRNGGFHTITLRQLKGSS